jgi:hypothetical protein
MGMASVVVFINDSIHEMEDDPTAGELIANAIRGIYHDGAFRYGEAVCYGHVSGHDVIVRTGYGGKRLDHVESLPPIVAHMLKSALEREGYRVIKPRNPKVADR